MGASLRSELRNLIDELPADELHAAQRFLVFLRPPGAAGTEPQPSATAQPPAEPDTPERLADVAAAPEHSLLNSLRRAIEAVDELVDQERDRQRVPGIERSFWRLRVDDAKVLIRLNADGSVRIVTTRPAPELRRETRLERGA